MVAPKAHNLECLAMHLSHQFWAETERPGGRRPYVVSITGDGAVGKSTLAKAIEIRLRSTAVISTDGFILSRVQRRSCGNITGDDPRAIDADALVRAVDQVVRDKVIWNARSYDHVSGQIRVSRGRNIEDIRLVLIEGAHSFHERLLPFIDFKIFLHASRDTRYTLRLEVDTQQRGYSRSEFEANWREYARLYDEVVATKVGIADLVIQITPERHYVTDLVRGCNCPEYHG